MYQQLIKPILFFWPPETAHHLALTLLELALKIPGLRQCIQKTFSTPNAKPLIVAGLRFANPVGLAAGFDKNGRHIHAMATLGFGFIEVGTVTPRAQSGNPKPRLFRLPADKALINRMGFNNDGLDALIQQLRKPRPAGLIIGGNIGKNKDTPNENAIQDYTTGFLALFPWVDYFAVNVSSPNTPNLRELQDKEPLMRLLLALQQLNATQPSRKPIFLKIAPDLSREQLNDIADIVRLTAIDGIIATNTTISRSGLRTAAASLQHIGPGGLSGAPLRLQSTEIIATLRKQLPPPFVIIGVGGIDGPRTAQEKLDAGADLVQLYTGFVYEGPAIVRRIVKSLHW